MTSSTIMPIWLFKRFIVRRAVRNPIRLLLLVCALAVSTTLISSVLRVSVASVSSFEESIGYSSQEYPLVVTPRGGRLSLPEFGSCFSSLRNSSDVVAYRREVGEVTTSSGSRAVSVVGVSGIQDGAGSERSVGDMLLSERLATILGRREGDPITAHVEGEELTGRVRIGPAPPGVPVDAVVVPLVRLSQHEREVLADGLLVKPRGDAPLEDYRRSLADFLVGCGALSVPIQVDTIASRVERGESLVAAYRFNIVIMAGMTLLVCAVLIAQATQLSLRTMSRELSVLQTLGVGKRACLLSILQEAAILGGVGALIGVTVGEPVTVRLTELFLQTAHEIYNISLGTKGSTHVAQRCAVVVGMILLATSGAALGALDALRISPSVGTRSEHLHVKPISSWWALPLAGMSVALFVIVYCLALFTDSTLIAYLFIAACLILVAGCTPAALSRAPAVLRRWRGSVFMWFARGGIQVGGRGFILGAIGAGLSMALICSLSLMVGSFRSTLERWTLQRLQGDLFVSAALEGGVGETRVSSELANAVRSLSDVRRVIPYYETMTTFQGDVLVVSASQLSEQLARGIYVVRSGSLDRGLLVGGRGALISESAARKLHLDVGDSLAIEGRPVVVTAIIQEFGTEHPLVQIDEGLFLELYPRQQPKNLTIDLAAHVSPDMVKGAVERLVGAVGTVRDNRELRDYALTLFDRTFRITLSIRWIVFGIALLGLVLASLQNLWERRREIKTMYVLGFSPGQIIGAHVAENTVVCALPVLIGLIGGVALGWGLTEFVNPRSFGWSIEFFISATPLLIALAFVIGVALVTFLATAAVLGRVLTEATLSDE
jgi:putative ABC transport system permease protein